MIVPTFVVLLSLAIYQVASAPAGKPAVGADGRIEYDGTYKRLYLPYIQAVAKDGTIKILTSEDVLGYAKKLDAGEIPSTTIHQLIGINGFKHTLSDHQLRRMVNQEVGAIVNPSELNQPGFGHLFITTDAKGIAQTFIYNINLEEASDKVAKEGYPNSSADDSYHQNKPSANVVASATA